MDETLEVYLIQNSTGQYYKYSKWLRQNKDYSSVKDFGWVDDYREAKKYFKIGPCKGIITRICKSNPDAEIPSILGLTLVTSKVFDETERINKVRIKDQKTKQELAEWQKKCQLEDAERELQRAQAKRDLLKGN